MITLYYNTITKELRHKLINDDLSEQELEGIINPLIKDYPFYKKNRTISNRLILTSIISVVMLGLLFMLIILNNAPIHIVAGSSGEKTVVMILVAFLLIAVLCLIVSAFFSMKYVAYVHAHHLMKLLNKHQKELTVQIKNELGY